MVFCGRFIVCGSWRIFEGRRYWTQPWAWHHVPVSRCQCRRSVDQELQPSWGLGFGVTSVLKLQTPQASIVLHMPLCFRCRDTAGLSLVLLTRRMQKEGQRMFQVVPCATVLLATLHGKQLRHSACARSLVSSGKGYVDQACGCGECNRQFPTAPEHPNSLNLQSEIRPQKALAVAARCQRNRLPTSAVRRWGGSRTLGGFCYLLGFIDSGTSKAP